MFAFLSIVSRTQIMRIAHYCQLQRMLEWNIIDFGGPHVIDGDVVYLVDVSAGGIGSLHVQWWDESDCDLLGVFYICMWQVWWYVTSLVMCDNTSGDARVIFECESPHVRCTFCFSSGCNSFSIPCWSCNQKSPVKSKTLPSWCLQKWGLARQWSKLRSFARFKLCLIQTFGLNDRS